MDLLPPELQLHKVLMDRIQILERNNTELEAEVDQLTAQLRQASAPPAKPNHASTQELLFAHETIRRKDQEIARLNARVAELQSRWNSPPISKVKIDLDQESLASSSDDDVVLESDEGGEVEPTEDASSESNIWPNVLRRKFPAFTANNNHPNGVNANKARVAMLEFCKKHSLKDVWGGRKVRVIPPHLHAAFLEHISLQMPRLADAKKPVESFADECSSGEDGVDETQILSRRRRRISGEEEDLSSEEDGSQEEQRDDDFCCRIPGCQRGGVPYKNKQSLLVHKYDYHSPETSVSVPNRDEPIGG
ncbi:hypothetical protein HDU98_006332 [Podochytrium sp. JEL0797]|nr:hypothetical protein HDU98_006332 [Podochytrium sp. JEL0797]